MTLRALQPPTATGLVFFAQTGLSEGVLLRLHTDSRQGPYGGANLGLIGPVPSQPLWLCQALNRRLRREDLDDALAALREGSSRAIETPVGVVRRCAGPGEAPVLEHGRHELTGDEVERLADVWDRYAADAAWERTWPVRFVARPEHA